MAFTLTDGLHEVGDRLKAGVFLSRDKRFVVKSTRPPQFIDAEMFDETCKSLHAEHCNERSLLEAMDGILGGSVKLHRAEDLGKCAPLTIIMDSAGATDVLRLVSGRISASTIGRLAARAIRLLRAVHSFGFVHGDVHMSNFMFDGRDVATAKVIDFGRSEPFLVRGGDTHIPDATGRDTGFLDRSLLSPWELDGHPVSRRDDLYRLSEGLLHLAGRGPLMVGEDNELAKHQREPGADILAQFRNRMLELGFDERPPYEEWIERFQAVENTNKL